MTHSVPTDEERKAKWEKMKDYDPKSSLTRRRRDAVIHHLSKVIRKILTRAYVMGQLDADDLRVQYLISTLQNIGEWEMNATDGMIQYLRPSKKVPWPWYIAKWNNGHAVISQKTQRIVAYNLPETDALKLLEFNEYESSADSAEEQLYIN